MLINSNNGLSFKLFPAAKKGRYSHAKRVETARAAAQFWKEQQPDSESKQELETQAGSSEIIDTLQKTNPQGQSEQTFDVQREQLNGCVSENSEVCKPTKIECLPENASCSTEQEYIPSQGEQLQTAESSGTIKINRGFAISTVSNTDRDAVNDETQSSSSADDTQIYPLPSIELVRFFNESLPCDRAGQLMGAFFLSCGKLGYFMYMEIFKRISLTEQIVGVVY